MQNKLSKHTYKKDFVNSKGFQDALGQKTKQTKKGPSGRRFVCLRVGQVG